MYSNPKRVIAWRESNYFKFVLESRDNFTHAMVFLLALVSGTHIKCCFGHSQAAEIRCEHKTDILLSHYTK